MDGATLVSLSLDDIEAYESASKPSIKQSLARKRSISSISSFSSSDSTDPLLPEPVTSSIGAETLNARTKGIVRRIASYIRPQPVVSSTDGKTMYAKTKATLKRLTSYIRLPDEDDAYFLLFCAIFPCGIGILLSMFSAFFGAGFLSGHEPYRSADGGLWAAGAAGGAVLGLVSGILLFIVGVRMEIPRRFEWLVIGALAALVGIFGQALGVIMLPAGESGGLDVRHALIASVTGFPVAGPWVLSLFYQRDD
ncbi:predicted protein [Postia placenta Mad-698-R]|uniref:Uncharacterized protein n=1 Tax=Postia placenta MAD-698-R-SB12 TaxID=670580 RepID=A0A1X6MN25_9APHY|nr:hypothetical protein POSPLADRAFT_1156316 [Postia placenta MAD-698-R-SB12]EED80105.1 predicted protein [Postia placenta Mad-698-R]OSX57592.1 hypothetical protein POSPLADRAFT_1156316 [Postia placenta MAD-698-R-SB12]